MLKTSLIFATFAALATLTLGGCQTATAVRNASSGGVAGLASCPQIYSAFDAYDQDKQSMESLSQIAGVTNTDIQGVTPENASSYYQTIRDTANIALAVQGCQPLQ